MAWYNRTTFPGEKQQETLFGPHQYSLFAAQKMNAYEEKQNARKARYERRSEAAREQAVTESNEASSMLNVITDCQPIHVGHHSERGHRSLIKRSGVKMRKSIAYDEKADYYANKAEAVGNGGISSDDPHAIEKLEKKLEAAEAKQERMKAANKIIRKNQEDKDSLMALGFSEKESEELIHPPRWMPSVGFPSYALTNNLSKIKQTKARLKVLKRLAQAETVEIVKNGYTLRHDTEENRVMFILDGKPSNEIRTILKKYAFKWSPRRGAWVRQATANGIFAARCARKALDALEG
ncbi:DUF3560 domain-containing protein [Saccharibacter floricola]|uniref:DUF3560 domain-containing protein n=1 Tax=Saccharibacter floricola DSM 15669 TaxID=1123227 RepID=A0ABQ0P0J7_9PROT|nr:DUF3560 domain-containing protein [Saccharibacter floricola]GBQ07902.1 hypothetical protein AA15669_1588 [Saccharibacter floricola DSM 15669]